MAPQRFLVVWKRSALRLIEFTEYPPERAAEAAARCTALEREHAADRDLEIVLFSADSEADLRRTHGKYFVGRDS